MNAFSRRDVELALAGDAEIPDGALAVAAAGCRIRCDVVRVASGELRRASVWMGPTGVVGLPDAGDEAQPTEGTIGPPTLALGLLTSAMAPTPSVVASRTSRRSVEVLELAESVAEGTDPTTLVLVSTHSLDSVEPPKRWVVLEAREGRSADFSAQESSALLVPCSGLELLRALAALTAGAVEAPESSEPGGIDGDGTNRDQGGQP